MSAETNLDGPCSYCDAACRVDAEGLCYVCNANPDALRAWKAELHSASLRDSLSHSIKDVLRAQKEADIWRDKYRDGRKDLISLRGKNERCEARLSASQNDLQGVMKENARLRTENILSLEGMNLREELQNVLISILIDAHEEGPDHNTEALLRIARAARNP